MKNQFKILLIITTAMVIGCKKENEYPKPTQEGKDTFGMYVNGEVWVPSITRTILEPDPLYAYYNKGNGDLSIFSFNREKEQNLKFHFYGIKKPGIYRFSFVRRFPTEVNGGYEYGTDTTRFQIDDQYLNSYFLKDSTMSQLEITKIDTVWNIVSGKFYVTLFNKSDSSMKITNGIFDLKTN